MIALIPFLAAMTTAAAPAQPTANPAPTAAVQAPAPIQTAAKKGVDPDKIVCKTIVTTGTRFADRDCRRQGEWDQLSADSKRATTETVDRQAVMFSH